MSNSIEKLVGQLIIAGFRGKSIKNDSPIVNYIKNFNMKIKKKAPILDLKDILQIKIYTKSIDIG